MLVPMTLTNSHVRADIAGDGIGEGRNPDAGGERSGLMLAVEDDGLHSISVLATTCSSFMFIM